MRATIPTPAEIAIDDNRRLLNRYRFVEHECIRLLAGWLPKTALFELKCELGRALWEDAQHVEALYLRLREIQSPAFQKPADDALVTLMQELPHAPSELAFASGVWLVVKPALLRAYKAHEKATFPNSDFPSVYAIEHILLDETNQISRVTALLDQARAAGKFTAQDQEWQDYVAALLKAAGGASGDDPRPDAAVARPGCRRPFQAPREAERDERFTNRLGETEKAPDETAYEAHTSYEFERYSTEMLAAETVAVVLYHHFHDMPWEFVRDTARHLYDEVRHCLMGYEWMRLHNVDPFKTPQYLHIFKWRTQFRPVEQYCLLTMGNEVNAFPYRHRRVEEHHERGDRLSEQFVRYDIADETQHVRFGKRWLPDLVAASGEKRSVEQFTEDVLAIWHREYKSGRLSLQVE